MGPRILPETTVGKHNPPCHLQMPTKALSCKKEAVCEHGPEVPSCLWAKAHLKWTVSNWKSVLWSDESKFDILVGNHGRRVLRAKEEGDLPACYQRSVQKPASLMVWGYIKVYKGFRATYAPLQTMSISGKALCISARQCKTTYCCYYNSMAS